MISVPLQFISQFHPIPENDEWWGKGFTEWTNVVKTKPLFEGHHQPQLPTELGFYDLRVPEVREEQASMAKEHGIYGFCYYHYWFNGRRILERPFQEVFESGNPDFPFMLCWANENWSRAWDGQDKEILLEQKYSEEDDRAHIKALIPYFKDERYIRVDGKPVMCIYRSSLLPEIKRTTSIWREEARKKGLELYLCRFESFGLGGKELIEVGGFDAAVDFQPMTNSFEIFRKKKREEYEHRELANRVKTRAIRNYLKYFNREQYELLAQMQWNVWDYEEYVDFIIQQPFPDYKLFPGICPGWDNYARKKKNYLILKNSTPSAYKKWLQHISKNFIPKSNEENFIFINAWNEWAEGNHLEPCTRWERKYLQATKEALTDRHS